MRIICCFKGLLLAAAFLAAPAKAEPFQQKLYAQLGGWKIQASQADGAHMNCGAIAPGDAYVEFGKSREGWTLLVRTRTKEDGERPGVVAIDGKSSKAAFMRFEGDAIGTFLKSEQLKAIRAGKSLTVTVGAETTTVALEGAAAALRKAQACDDNGGA